MAEYLLFVYGTLKQGYGNHRYLKRARYVGEDYAPGVLYGDGASVPVAVETDQPDDWIKGEVYAVDEATLERCDRLESHPIGYTRTCVELRGGDRAFIYYWFHDVQWYGTPIAGGEWTHAVPVAVPARPAPADDAAPVDDAPVADAEDAVDEWDQFARDLRRLS